MTPQLPISLGYLKTYDKALSPKRVPTVGSTVCISQGTKSGPGPCPNGIEGIICSFHAMDQTNASSTP